MTPTNYTEWKFFKCINVPGCPTQVEQVRLLPCFKLNLYVCELGGGVCVWFCQPSEIFSCGSHQNYVTGFCKVLGNKIFYTLQLSWHENLRLKLVSFVSAVEVFKEIRTISKSCDWFHDINHRKLGIMRGSYTCTCLCFHIVHPAA